MEAQIKKVLTQYLFFVFVVLGLFLYFKEGYQTGVWSMGGPSSRVPPILKGNILVWICLLTSLIIYVAFALFKKKTHLSISAGHVFLILSYLILPIWWEYKILYVVINCFFGGANLYYWMHSSKEKEQRNILDS